ncbi:MAG: zf-TFIIB domain-containing protein [Sedimentisphaerales bacterium]|nr:zf-TFIIB domain-containing protein [Sedimentisphaerales bacterium]
MKCPACSNTLQQMTVEGITVDVCKGGCGGIWFDIREINKFDEPHESAGQVLLDIERDENIVVDHNKKFNCPKCQNIIMFRHFFSIKHKVAVDECPNCGGIWLDAGELRQIRSLFNTEEERHEAAGQYLQNTFGDELEAMAAESQAKLEKARKFANTFKFVCPSYYIPGKQAWGAF